MNNQTNAKGNPMENRVLAHARKSAGLYCAFYLSERLFGLNILNVREVNMEIRFTPIPHAPAEFRGYVNIRGQIFLIVDPKILLGLPAQPLSAQSRLILFKPGIFENLGVLVDRVGDVVEIGKNQIEDRRKNREKIRETGERRTEMSRVSDGVCKLDDQLMVILNAPNLVDILKSRAAAHLVRPHQFKPIDVPGSGE